MAPRSVSTVQLAAGDIVSAAAYSWGRPFARQMGDNSGRNDEVRVEGKVPATPSRRAAASWSPVEIAALMGDGVGGRRFGGPAIAHCI